MRWDADCINSAAGPRGGESGTGDDIAYHLLRQSHIFASLVREMLQVKPLQEVSRSPLTVSQFYLLKLMSSDGGLQVGEVAGFLGMTPPAATKNIDKLERLGLVARTPSRGDRRATLLSVRPKGRRLVQRYEAVTAARLSAVMERFRPEEIEQFAGLLGRFSASSLDLDRTEGEHCLRCAACFVDDCPVREIRGGCPYQRVVAARTGERGGEESS